MKLFLTHPTSGEDAREVMTRMKLVVEALESSGHTAYFSGFDTKKTKLQEAGDIRGIFEYAFHNLAKADGLVAVLPSNRKSEGQLMEIGAMLAAGKPVYLFLHDTATGTPTHLTKLAAKTFIWSNDTTLVDSLSQI